MDRGWAGAGLLADSAAQVARQPGWGKMEPCLGGNRHNSDGICGGLHLELEGRIGLYTGEEGGELGFGHAGLGCFLIKASGLSRKQQAKRDVAPWEHRFSGCCWDPLGTHWRLLVEAGGAAARRPAAGRRPEPPRPEGPSLPW